MKKKKESNPMFTKKGAWLWLLCAPAALIVSAHYDAKKNKKKRAKKRQEKKRSSEKNGDFTTNLIGGKIIRAYEYLNI